MDKSRYWKLVRINGAGNSQIVEIAAAKEFFFLVFSEFSSSDHVPCEDIEQQLLKWVRDASNPQMSVLAQRCLLCMISWQIEQVCLQLENQFGNVHGFSCRDLLPYVLDDDGSLEPATSHNCLSRRILQSFAPEQSSLTTWTNIRVKQHPELSKFLLECGVYLITDWAILNDTQPKQLKQILGKFHCFTPTEIDLAQGLLESYHAIYRADRLQKRARGIRGQCAAPTIEQLEQICEGLERKTNQKLKSETVMRQLQNLANNLRQYRIHVRGGCLPTVFINESLVERIPSPDSAEMWENQEEQAEFLQCYRSQFKACLDQALGIVMQSRVKQLQGKDEEQAKKFLRALYLFHCEKVSMTEIAKRLGLRAQDAVTRLLKLKEFRADVRQQLLVMLRSHVLELAQNYSTLENLTTLEQEITLALDEEISSLISEVETEAQSAKNKSSISHFTKRLCQQLKKESEVKINLAVGFKPVYSSTNRDTPLF